MISRMHMDHARFRRIVHGKVRENLRKYMSSGELIGRQGGQYVSIPMRQIALPRFRHGGGEEASVGSGDGEPGDVLGRAGDGEGAGGAGEQGGRHLLEVEVSLDELAAILGEALELPRILPRGRRQLMSERGRYDSIAVNGPNSLRHNRRTYREALKRQIIAGLYDPANPVVIPIRRDLRFRSWKPRPVPESAAAVFYVMDVSGSMGDEQKEIVRLTAWWIDLWLRAQYKGVEVHYLAHDAAAREVPRDMFFRLRESGGTKISSAYDLLARIVRDRYSSGDWNLYVLQFSDGDNWGGDDTARCLEMLRATLLPAVNLFAYGQVRSAYGSGQFLKDLRERLVDPRLVTAEIPDREHIPEVLKAFLGKGR